MKIALLGCGRIGVIHAANIVAHPSARLVGVFDVNREAASAIAERYGVKLFEAAQDVFASNDVDAVLIASTSTHCDSIEAAVSAWKAVLCEKPIDLSLKRIKQCKARIASTNIPIMLGFVRRFDPGHRAAREALLNGEIGDLHQVTIVSRDPDLAPDAYIEVSGSIFRDMTIHDFDLARYMREEVQTVSATASRLVNPALMARRNDYDTTSVTFTTPSGKQAIIVKSRHAAYGYDQRIELFGDKGMVISENEHSNNVTKHLQHATGVRTPLLNFFIEHYAEAFNAEISSFVEAGAPVEVAFEDGLRAQTLAEAALKSVTERRAVDIAEIGNQRF